MTQMYDEAVDADVDVDSAQPDLDAGGLRGDIYAQLMQLGPADHEALAQLLQLYPGQQEQILQIAAPRMGNSAVQRALAIVRNAAVGTPSAQGRADVNQFFREENSAPSAGNAAGAMADFWEVNGPPASQTTGQGVAPSQGDADSQARAADAMADFAEVNAEPAAPSSGWELATRYNAAHQHYVDEFNSLTDAMCVGRDGVLDPELVSKWQASHGLVADGMVGPLTVAAAHKAAEAKQAEAPQAPNIEEIEEELE
jgi:hypothetical protein